MLMHIMSARLDDFTSNDIRSVCSQMSTCNKHFSIPVLGGLRVYRILQTKQNKRLKPGVQMVNISNLAVFSN